MNARDADPGVFCVPEFYLLGPMKIRMAREMWLFLKPGDFAFTPWLGLFEVVPG